MTLTRKIIRVELVKSHSEFDGIGYIRITQFGEDTAERIWRKPSPTSSATQMEA